MKRLVIMFLVLCMMLSLFACGKDDEEANPIIRIGVYEPLSGNNSAGGIKEMLGIQYAHFKQPTVKIGNQTYDVELVYADIASNKAQAAEAAQKLIEQEVALVLGPYGSEYALAAAPVFEEYGIAAIGITCTAPSITANYDSYFRVCIQDELQGAALANFADKEVGASTVLCLGQVENEYDQGLIKGFREAAAGLGITTMKMDFAENCGDFTYYVSALAENGVDAIFAPCSARYGKLIVEAMGQLPEAVPIIGGDLWDDDSMLDAAIGKHFRIYTSAFYAEGGSTSFENGFKEWLETDELAMTNNGGTDHVSALSVMGYDAYNLALAAISQAGSPHHADILAAMPSVSSSGVSGVIQFDDIGDAVRNSIYIKRADTEIPQWLYVKNQKVN